MSRLNPATILVVDDEDGMRTLLRHQLSDLGYVVVEAGHGLGALHLVRMQPSKFDLVISDVVMPLMNGIELAATLKGEYPDLPVILISAYTPTALTRVGIDHAVVPVVMKPYTRDELAELIELTLESPAALS